MKSLAIRFFLSVLAIGSLPAFATATPDPDTRATEAADTGGPLATGLIPNPDFNGTGKLVLMPSTSGGWARDARALRVFEWRAGTPLSAHAGYYVVGKQRRDNDDDWRLWVARVSKDGTLSTSFGVNGWLYENPSSGPNSARDIVDVALSGNRLYTLLDVADVGESPNATVVQCLELDNALNSCFSGIMPGIHAWKPNGGALSVEVHNQRLIVAGVDDFADSLFVAARVRHASEGWRLGIARLNSSDGSAVTSFADDGYFLGRPSGSGDFITANDLLYTENQLLVGGQYQTSTSSGLTDGYILGLNGSDGGYSSNPWKWRQIFGHAQATDAHDSVNVLARVQQNPVVSTDYRILYAGWTGEAYGDPLIMGRLHANGSWEANGPDKFCPSVGGGLACLIDPIVQQEWQPETLPIGVGERIFSRDLIVVQDFSNLAESAQNDPAVRTLVQHYSPTGEELRQELFIDYSSDMADLSDNMTIPNSMLITGRSLTPVESERIAIAGTRKWENGKYDATLTVLITGEIALPTCIFTDDFEAGTGTSCAP